MATHQEQIAKYAKINDARMRAEKSLDVLANCLIDRLLPFEQRGELKITPSLLTAIVCAVTDAVQKGEKS